MRSRPRSISSPRSATKPFAELRSQLFVLAFLQHLQSQDQLQRVKSDLGLTQQRLLDTRQQLQDSEKARFALDTRFR